MYLYPGNVPRLTDNGLLIEESRTNLNPWSEDLTNWSSGSWSVTPNNTTAPDGTNTADLCILNNGAPVTHSLSEPVDVVSGTVYTASIFAKADAFNSFALRPTGLNTYKCDFTLTGNGVAKPAAGSGTATIIPLTNDWYYCTYTFTEPTGGTRNYGVQVGPGAVGDGTSGFYVWGAQLEQGDFATSYIPTAGQAGGVTRAADIADVDGTDFTSWYNTNASTWVVSGIQEVVDANKLQTGRQVPFIDRYFNIYPQRWSATAWRCKLGH